MIQTLCGTLTSSPNQSIPQAERSDRSNLLPALAEGQVRASGNLINLNAAPRPGRIPVLNNITDPRYEAYARLLPGGSYVQAAIYSEHFHHVAIMRKILLRMSAWMNYLFPFH